MIKLLITCLALSVSGMAYGEKPVLTIPISGSLQLQSKSTGNRPIEATFNGSKWVSGRLVLVALGESQHRWLTIVLIPTPSESALLPHYNNRRNNLRPALVQPKNEQYLLAKIFPQSLQDKLMRGEQENASVVGRFKLESLHIGAECGSQWAHTVISEFQLDGPVQLAALDLPGGC